jgi:hypothetical protein
MKWKYASPLGAARDKAAAWRGETLVPGAGTVSGELTMLLVEICPLEPMDF